MFSDKHVGVAALVVTMFIFSSSGSVFQRIVDLEIRSNSSNTSMNNRSNHSAPTDVPVFTACNMLCGSNLIGLVTLPPLFKADLNMKKIRVVGC